MSVTVVVGGQWGSEAKAKCAIHLAKAGKIWREDVVGVRCGGPNAGHTIWVPSKGRDDGDANYTKYVLRMIPSLVVNPHAKLYIAAGSMVDEDLLMKEIADLENLGLRVRDRLYIDAEVALVSDEAIQMEKLVGLGNSIGSTQTGTGGTAALRSMRRTKTAGESDILHRFVQTQIWRRLCEDDTAGYKVVIEGTQGYALSLYHAGYYPYCTSKPATAAQFITEAGIPPASVTNVVVVIRTYPIRVGGNSGPMKNEISWDTIKKRSGCPHDLIEMTSVTKKMRRVSEFDVAMVRDAVQINGATALAVHGLDYLDYENHGIRNCNMLTDNAKEWVARLEDEVGVPVALGFTGPHQNDVAVMDDIAKSL